MMNVRCVFSKFFSFIFFLFIPFSSYSSNEIVLYGNDESRPVDTVGINTRYDSLVEVSFHAIKNGTKLIFKGEDLELLDLENNESKHYVLNKDIAKKLILVNQEKLDPSFRLRITPQSPFISWLEYYVGQLPVGLDDLEPPFSLRLSYQKSSQFWVNLWLSHRVPIISIRLKNERVKYFYNEKLLKESSSYTSVIQKKIDQFIAKGAAPFLDEPKGAGFMTKIPFLLTEIAQGEDIVHVNFFSPLKKSVHHNNRLKRFEKKTNLKDLIYASRVGLNQSKIKAVLKATEVVSNPTLKKARKKLKSKLVTSDSDQDEISRLNAQEMRKIFFGDFGTHDLTDESKKEDNSTFTDKELYKNISGGSDGFLGAASLRLKDSPQGRYYEIEKDGNCLIRAIEVAIGRYQFALASQVDGSSVRDHLRDMLIGAANQIKTDKNKLIATAIAQDFLAWIRLNSLEAQAFHQFILSPKNGLLSEQSNLLFLLSQIHNLDSYQSGGEGSAQLLQGLLNPEGLEILKNYIETRLTIDGQWETSQTIGLAMALYYERKLWVYDATANRGTGRWQSFPESSTDSPIFLRFTGTHYETFINLDEQTISGRATAFAPLGENKVEGPLKGKKRRIPRLKKEKASEGVLGEEKTFQTKELHFPNLLSSNEMEVEGGSGEEKRSSPPKTLVNLDKRGVLTQVDSPSSRELEIDAKSKEGKHSSQRRKQRASGDASDSLTRSQGTSPSQEHLPSNPFPPTRLEIDSKLLQVGRSTEVARSLDVMHAADGRPSLEEKGSQPFKKRKASENASEHRKRSKKIPEFPEPEKPEVIQSDVSARLLYKAAENYEKKVGKSRSDSVRQESYQYWEKVVDSPDFKTLSSEKRAKARHGLAMAYSFLTEGDNDVVVNKKRYQLWDEVERAAGFKYLSPLERAGALYRYAFNYSFIDEKSRDVTLDRQVYKKWNLVINSPDFKYLSLKTQIDALRRRAFTALRQHQQHTEASNKESYKSWDAVVNSEGFKLLKPEDQVESTYLRARVFHYWQRDNKNEAMDKKRYVHWNSLVQSKYFHLLDSKSRLSARYERAFIFDLFNKFDDTKIDEERYNNWKSVVNSSDFKKLDSKMQAYALYQEATRFHRFTKNSHDRISNENRYNKWDSLVNSNMFIEIEPKYQAKAYYAWAFNFDILSRGDNSTDTNRKRVKNWKTVINTNVFNLIEERLQSDAYYRYAFNFGFVHKGIPALEVEQERYQAWCSVKDSVGFKLLDPKIQADVLFKRSLSLHSIILKSEARKNREKKIYENWRSLKETPLWRHLKAQNQDMVLKFLRETKIDRDR